MFLIALAVVAAVRITTPVPESGQMDVLRRGEGEWVRSATVKHEQESELASSSETRAVLIRYPGRATYWFAEVPGGAEGAIAASEFRDVVVSGAGDESRTYLYLASEDAPREANGNRFERVPVESGIACVLDVDGDRCIAIASDATTVAVNELPHSSFRMFHGTPQQDDEFNVRAPGNVALRPRDIPAKVLAAGAWTAIGIDASWDDVAVDRTGAELALERSEGKSLSPLPSFARLAGQRERGLTLRAYSGGKRVEDPRAMLLLFPERSAMPLAFAEADLNGEFQLPQLGSGTYMARLLSAVTTSELVKITAGASARTDVSFPAGPMVRGRAVRTSGGSATDPVIVELSLQLTLDEVMGVDVLDFVRTGTAAADGSFELVLPSPGAYRLRVRWGAASAERQFTFTESMRGVDLGELELARGTGVHGVLPGCMEGEAILMAVPDVSKPVTAGFNMTRRAPIANGRFYAEGVGPGLWTALLKCGGTTTHVTPETFLVTGEADVVIEFAPAH